MKRGKCSGINVLRGFLLPLMLVAVMLLFMTALSNLENGRGEEGRRRLEESIRRASVACYAAEGIYPPDLEYLEEHYGIQINETEYVVFYHIFGSNMMPEITVVERET